MFSVMLKDAKQGRITSERIGAVTGIDTNVDYYMIGLKQMCIRDRPMGARVFDLQQILGRNEMPEVSQIAKMLSEKTWE